MSFIPGQLKRKKDVTQHYKQARSNILKMRRRIRKKEYLDELDEVINDLANWGRPWCANILTNLYNKSSIADLE